MAQQFTNNARALLVAGISDTATSIVIESTKADLFPVANVGSSPLPSTNSWFKATLQDVSGSVEIVAVRTRAAGSGILANVIRGYDGTTPLAFTAGTVIGLRITAADVQFALSLPDQDVQFTGDNSFTGANTFSGPTTLNSPTLTGAAVAPTATAGTNTTQVATTAFVATAVTNATGSLGTMSTQNANNVNITGGTISGLSAALPVASGGTGNTALAANSVLIGNGTNAVQSVAPGTYGNVLTSNGSAWTSAAPQTIVTGAGVAPAGGSFTVQTGSTGKCLITLQGNIFASFGSFGDGTVLMRINGADVASQVGRTMEYDSRTSGANPLVTYLYSGSPNTSVSVSYLYSGPGGYRNGSFSFIGT